MVAVHAGNMVPFNRKLIPAVSSDSADVGRMFLFQDAGGQRVFRIIIIDGNCSLRDDRAVIKARSDEVDRAACDFDAGFNGLSLGMKPAEARKQSRMAVDDPVRECMNQIFSADSHVAGKADEIGLI